MTEETIEYEVAGATALFVLVIEIGNSIPLIPTSMDSCLL